MALDPRIILGIRPLETVAEMGDKRRVRDIAEQEVELRRQEIALRGQALRDAAERRNQPAAYDPKKADEELTYQMHLGDTVHGQLVAAQKNPAVWSVARQNIARLAGPQAITDLPEDWESAAPIVDTHIKSWDGQKTEIKHQLQMIEVPDPNDATKTVRQVVELTPGATFPTVPKAATADGDLTKSSIDVQAADALKRGDMDAYNRLLKVKKEIGRADDRPPTTIRMQNGMTPGQAFSSERQLRNDFSRETKSAQTVAQQLALMESSLAAVKQGKAAAGSQGVLVTFQKILDPTSVVRESEYARSASGLSLLGQIEGKWDQIRQGGAGVTAADLEQFVSLARAFNKNQQAFAKQTKDQIDAVAKEYGLDPSRITKDTDVQTPGAATVTASAGPKVGDIVTYNGKRYSVKGIKNGKAQLEAVP